MGVIDPPNKTPEYIAPVSLSGGLSSRMLVYPDEPEYHAAIGDMLKRLAQIKRWEGEPDDRQKAVWEMREMLESFFMYHMVGTIFLNVMATRPANWLPCDGQTYTKAAYPLLWEVIHPSLKDGNNFSVPNLYTRIPLNAGDGMFQPQGFNHQAGEANVTLTTAQMPVHTHTTQPHNHSYMAAGALTLSIGEVPFTLATPPTLAITSSETVVVNNAGSGQAHNNMPPYIRLFYTIVAG
jgi:microcystin-dependent protein